MKVTVEKLTDITLINKACSFTAGFNVDVKSPYRMYKAEHSPIRTQMYWVEMYDIPTFVSVHLVRHKVGVEHFVKSNRHDRGGDEEATRLTPVNHAMLINAQSLINMARKRMCSKASYETRDVFNEIVNALKTVDYDLAMCLMPDCMYRGNLCYEFQSCGRCPKGY